MRTRGAGLKSRPQHHQTERAGWDRMFVKECSGERDLNSNSILLRPAVCPVVLREKQPVRCLVWAGKVLEGDAVGTMKSGLEPVERSREGG